VDVILPAEAELRVKPGVRVQGGASVLAAMPVLNAQNVPVEGRS